MPLNIIAFKTLSKMDFKKTKSVLQMLYVLDFMQFAKVTLLIMEVATAGVWKLETRFPYS